MTHNSRNAGTMSMAIALGMCMLAVGLTGFLLINTNAGANPCPTGESPYLGGDCTDSTHTSRHAQGNYSDTNNNQSCQNGATNPPACNNNVHTCNNGATNPPACNNNVHTCTNGATNPPACNNNVQTCSNGATNPPACNNIVLTCNNGATNPPACDNNNGTNDWGTGGGSGGGGGTGNTW